MIALEWNVSNLMKYEKEIRPSGYEKVVQWMVLFRIVPVLKIMVV